MHLTYFKKVQATAPLSFMMQEKIKHFLYWRFKLILCTKNNPEAKLFQTVAYQTKTVLAHLIYTYTIIKLYVKMTSVTIGLVITYLWSNK